MEHAAVEHVICETELPGAIPVLKLGPIEHVVLARQTDPTDRRHPVERSGPQNAIASGVARFTLRRCNLTASIAEDHRLVFGLACCRDDPAGEKTDLLLFGTRQTLVKAEQVCASV